MERTSGQPSFIVITGSESTGKTQLAKQLADHYKWSWVPELSRTYVEGLNRKYTYHDVEYIAKKQIAQFANCNAIKPVIFDTGLIITKVWFDVVYNRCPICLIEAIKQLPKNLHLLCDTDLPWEPDNVRENGGEMREKLKEMYKQELEYFEFPFSIVSGLGDNRMKNAIQTLTKNGIGNF